jgi:endoglucanase
VGGPNWERQDSIEKNKKYGVKYPFKEAAKSYVDLTTSFASNEVCINWNAPLIFLLGFLETSAN